MGRFGKMLYVELIKMKHTFLYPYHVLLPVIGSGLFLVYYRWIRHGMENGIGVLVEITGVALPLVISIVCAGNISLEAQNHFQIFLENYKCRWKGLAAKLLVLWSMGFLSVSAAIVIFTAGYGELKKQAETFGETGQAGESLMMLVVILAIGSIPVYVEHLFWNFVFPASVSQCIGVAESILSALFLTGLGDGIWQYVPCTWSARGVTLFWEISRASDEMRTVIYHTEMKKTGMICTLLLAGICVIIGLWFQNYEGRQWNE